MKAAATPKPFSPAITLCKMCRERTFWAKLPAPAHPLAARQIVLLERDPDPAGAYTFVGMERRTPIVTLVYATGAPEGAATGPRYNAPARPCPGPR
jgi:hypothetical protein